MLALIIYYNKLEKAFSPRSDGNNFKLIWFRTYYLIKKVPKMFFTGDNDDSDVRWVQLSVSNTITKGDCYEHRFLEVRPGLYKHLNWNYSWLKLPLWTEWPFWTTISEHCGRYEHNKVLKAKRCCEYGEQND